MHSHPDTFPLPDRRTLLLRGALVLLAATAGMLFFFRAFIFSGGEWITGDMADGRLILAIHEHWFRWLQGKEGWFDLGFFYPDRNALVYSDTFLLGGIIHSLLRSAGNDPYLSFQLAQMVMAAAGFAGMFTWLLAYRRCGFGYALFGAFMMLVASPIYMSARNSHIQLQSAWLVPWLLVLAEQVWRDRDKAGRELMASFGAACAIYGLIAYSTFYVAWFTLLFGTIWAGCAIALHGWRHAWYQLLPFLRRWRLLLPGILAAAGILWLFLKTYLSARLRHGGRPFYEVELSIPRLWDYVNHSETNLLWGKIFGYLHPYHPVYTAELELGFTLLFFASLVVFIVAILKDKGNQAGGDRMLRRTTAAAVAISCLLLFKVGEVTLWRIPYHLFPGSSGIRAVFRYNVVLLTPAIFLLVSGLQHLRASIPGLKGQLLIGLLGGLILLEQGQTRDIARINREKDLDTLHRLPQPPGDAESFFVYAGYTNNYQRDIAQSSAIIYAQHWNLPTVGGRSGFTPEGWDLLADDPSRLVDRVREYGRLRGLDGKLYLFNNDTLEWGPSVNLGDPIFTLETTIDLLEQTRFRALRTTGWSEPEAWGIWSVGRESAIILPQVEGGSYPLLLHMEFHGFINEKNPSQTVRIRLDNRLVAEELLTEEDVRRQIVMILDSGGMRIDIQVDRPASPKETVGGDDDRLLGIALDKLFIRIP